MSTSKRSRKQRKGQTVLAGKQEFSDGMALEGFTPTTQKAYGYAFDRFGRALKGQSALEATVGDAKRHLAGLKRAGVSRSVYGNASGALKFFFVKMRGLEWEPVSPHRLRLRAHWAAFWADCWPLPKTILILKPTRTFWLSRRSWPRMRTR